MSMDFGSTLKLDRSSFEQVCDACGCKYVVEVVKQGDQDETQHYNCPNPSCAKGYTTIGAMPPQVTPLDNCGG